MPAQEVVVLGIVSGVINAMTTDKPVPQGKMEGWTRPSFAIPQQTVVNNMAVKHRDADEGPYTHTVIQQQGTDTSNALPNNVNYKSKH